ncbi:hypothetical protein GQ42DRAFT_105428, partial [Ramicandelaber brevisporus]
LTYLVAAHERACFYTQNEIEGKKIAFYFAVQSGGNFDIDYTIKDPQDQIVLSGEAERQLDIVFSANKVGEYSFCFSNSMSTFVDKLVDFDITIEDEKPIQEHGMAAPDKGKSTTTEKTNKMTMTLDYISDGLSHIDRNLKFFRTRENRNMATVESTAERVFWFALAEAAGVIVIALIQVYGVRSLFNTRR